MDLEKTINFVTFTKKKSQKLHSESQTISKGQKNPQEPDRILQTTKQTKEIGQTTWKLSTNANSEPSEINGFPNSMVSVKTQKEKSQIAKTQNSSIQTFKLLQTIKNIFLKKMNRKGRDRDRERESTFSGLPMMEATALVTSEKIGSALMPSRLTFVEISTQGISRAQRISWLQKNQQEDKGIVLILEEQGWWLSGYIASAKPALQQ